MIIDVSGTDQYHGTSRFNDAQINASISILLKVTEQNDIAPHQATVISMYRAHSDRLQDRCRQSGLEEVQCVSVDSYQGNENDLILVCLVASNDEGNFGFVDDRKRINVAFTRARRGLVILTQLDMLYFAGASGLAHAIDHYSQRRAIFQYVEDENQVSAGKVLCCPCQRG